MNMEIKHCCFNTTNSCVQNVRIHVPLAEICTMNCFYCNYKYDKNISKNDNRPGIAKELVNGKNKIKDYLSEKITKFNDVNIIGVSGPGDPFQNPKALRYLIDIMKSQYNHLHLCLCTNGNFDYNEYIDILKFEQLKFITITINTLDALKSMQIYKSIDTDASAKKMINNQISLIKFCKEIGLKVKVNTVYLENINCDDIVEMYSQLMKYNVDCFNLIPQVKINSNNKDFMCDKLKYDNIIEELKSRDFPMIYHCYRCNADFCGK